MKTSNIPLFEINFIDKSFPFYSAPTIFFPHPLSNIAFDSECFCIWCAAFVFNISTVFSIFASQLASTRKKSAPREKKPEKICAGHWGSWYLKTLLFRKWTFLLQKMMINENSLAIWDVPLQLLLLLLLFIRKTRLPPPATFKQTFVLNLKTS